MATFPPSPKDTEGPASGSDPERFKAHSHSQNVDSASLSPRPWEPGCVLPCPGDEVNSRYSPWARGISNRGIAPWNRLGGGDSPIVFSATLLSLLNPPGRPAHGNMECLAGGSTRHRPVFILELAPFRRDGFWCFTQLLPPTESGTEGHPRKNRRMAPRTRPAGWPGREARIRVSLPRG